MKISFTSTNIIIDMEERSIEFNIEDIDLDGILDSVLDSSRAAELAEGIRFLLANDYFMSLDHTGSIILSRAGGYQNTGKLDDLICRDSIMEPNDIRRLIEIDSREEATAYLQLFKSIVEDIEAVIEEGSFADTFLDEYTGKITGRLKEGKK